jgi:hypothetical protein
MGTPTRPADLVFLHLSDIHFRRGRVGDAHDEDNDLRNELGRDLRRLRPRLPGLDGLIISGDIAFGGKKEEYDYAGGWIGSICEMIDCDRRSIMITPGNHDVDQDLIPPDGEVDVLHEEIRGAESLGGYDELLAGTLRDAVRAEKLLSPLAAYNSFANAFGCQVTAARPYWERDFGLGDGTKLRFRGMATVLLSSPRDDIETHKMLYGGAQRTILRLPNVRHAVVGHHPPSWTVEADTAEHVFSMRTCLQVFGHRHEQFLTRIGESVRLIAGAVHPRRGELQWQPRYAAIAISAANAGSLAICIYPRRWSNDELRFMPDYNSEGDAFREFTVAVDPRQTEGEE